MATSNAKSNINESNSEFAFVHVEEEKKTEKKHIAERGTFSTKDNILKVLLFPYTKSQSPGINDNQKHFEKQLERSSYILLILATILSSIYLCILAFLNLNPVKTKIYHSISIFIFLLFHKILLNLKKNSDQHKQYKEELIAKEKKIDENDRIVIIIIGGTIKFLLELNILYLLFLIVDIGQNVCFITILSSLEYIMIKYQYAILKVKIEFANFLGFILCVFAIIWFVFSHFSLYMGFIGLLIAILKFISVYLANQLSYLSSNHDAINSLNFFDGILGMIVGIFYLLFNFRKLSIEMNDLALLIVAFLAYYINTIILFNLNK